MTWVRIAEGAERMPHVVSSHSLNPEVLEAHLGLYRAIMFGPSRLTRAEREAIAVCVSAANDCHY
jgi:alkylhydroperoxidase family enzyme